MKNNNFENYPKSNYWICWTATREIKNSERFYREECLSETKTLLKL